VIGHNEVDVAIAVEIHRVDIGRFPAGREGGGSAESPRAVSEENCQRALAGVHHRDVEVSIAVEIGHRDFPGAQSDIVESDI
jgi:hypothetical protein